ncbi:MAG TPA: sugar-binding domain-containing protein, partial [Oscillatoriaceae cyanobacterium]
MSTSIVYLDGPWSFTTDPHDIGELEAWYARTSGFGRQVPVPSPWQLYGRDLQDYTGAAWYYRACEVPEAWLSQRVQLHVGASDYLTRVWMNGQFVGEHAGGYTPFVLDATEAARAGVNHLVIRVYDPRDNTEIPHGEQGRSFTRISGIWQPVHLQLRAACHLTRLLPKPALNPDRVDVIAELSLADATKVRFVLLDAAGEEVATAEVDSADGVAKATLAPPSPRRWSPEDPYLYRVQAAVLDGGDRLECHTGLREVWAIDGRLYLNGKPLFLRGAVTQGYWPETLYAAPTDEAIQKEIRLAKEAGFNVLRPHG